MTFPWHLYLMAFIYTIAGINHFRSPRMYQKIIPPYFPNPKLLNILSGCAEIILGIALIIPTLSSYAAWGIIVLLIAVFPTHIYMYQDEKVRMGLPKWILLLRMPLQLVLIYWGYQYT
ncbi:DoxX family protein [Flavobacterium frigoris]|uniref:Uncharacterized membrane protein n=1 Tax=Flavobacterium frigoris TaxID=229204 RepID=A0A1H9QDL3_FLAFI|nr:MauE/DoxX family redox-associated membrane protein [Flavobacterium frigoris]SER58527.1 Uncharacterized membrane protein [Flavobacterium frigoris]